MGVGVGGLVCVSERNVDDFSSDRSGKQNAAICQTAGDTGMRAALAPLELFKRGVLAAALPWLRCTHTC